MLNFEPWHRLLQQYVGDRGQVDYSRWQTEQPQVLSQWLQQLQKLDLQDSSHPEECLALWINLYNALVVAQVLERYPITSIRPKILGLPNWITFFQFFTRTVYTLGDCQYSLNQIEHGILRRDFDEPRIHFALVCASVGCPHLRAGAYWPDTVMEQLNEDAIRFITNPQKVRYDADAGVLFCSKIFKWYSKDFLKTSASVVSYIDQYLPTQTLIPATTPIRWLPYDWSLNGT